MHACAFYDFICMKHEREKNVVLLFFDIEKKERMMI